MLKVGRRHPPAPSPARVWKVHRPLLANRSVAPEKRKNTRGTPATTCSMTKPCVWEVCASASGTRRVGHKDVGASKLSPSFALKSATGTRTGSSKAFRRVSFHVQACPVRGCSFAAAFISENSSSANLLVSCDTTGCRQHPRSPLFPQAHRLRWGTGSHVCGGSAAQCAALRWIKYLFRFRRLPLVTSDTNAIARPPYHAACGGVSPIGQREGRMVYGALVCLRSICIMIGTLALTVPPLTTFGQII